MELTVCCKASMKSGSVRVLWALTTLTATFLPLALMLISPSVSKGETVLDLQQGSMIPTIFEVCHPIMQKQVIHVGDELTIHLFMPSIKWPQCLGTYIRKKLHSHDITKKCPVGQSCIT